MRGSADIRTTGYGTEPPLQRFLASCHHEFKSDNSGALADYIPELKRANPAHFGISLVTIDGHVYEVGDSAVPFTIQSVSKAFVFALALDLVGEARVAAAIGVEPSGEAFNSIRLTNDNKPFNPMVNAGAIACSGLIHEVDGGAAFERIRDKLSQFAGRELGVDDAVHASETATGNRNRAIAWLLRNYLVLQDDVDAVLDIYFRQCAILVTARDLAVMAATLANRGVNPVTGVQVVTPHVVARTLSVMTSSGMYDYAGEWIYRVGMPAKSGVGGGIVAALPSQLGLGTFSPLLDGHFNSVRGLRVCEALSARFDLHMLNRSGDVRTCIIADYDIFGITSRRSRRPHEQQILDDRHSDTRVIELVGALNFAAIDYVTRRLSSEPPGAPLLILDFRRVPDITAAGAQLLAEKIATLGNFGVTTIISGVETTSPVWATIRAQIEEPKRLRHFPLLDDAVEWAEDQLIYRYGGFTEIKETSHLGEQALLADLAPEEIAALAELSTPRRYGAGQRIVVAGEPANSLFFLQSGMVSVKLPSGVRLASLGPGMEFGEMAIIESHRSADVWADTPVKCLELPLDSFADYRQLHPQISMKIMRNLSALLARRLILANAKVDLLSAY
ncbi:glutaminase A [Bradyrhizobium australafricanum]|uniref:glutaminase A n=1 Tax=Bradyrhizobium australafricanum TaxID=2821406 RepID=UPI001CE2F3E6|nr:glutaminase A [Bradyrhizobium australafricanum]MCA6101695.1 glutaminase A [Bradyrhizobium australafricanum]